MLVYMVKRNKTKCINKVNRLTNSCFKTTIILKNKYYIFARKLKRANISGFPIIPVALYQNVPARGVPLSYNSYLNGSVKTFLKHYISLLYPCKTKFNTTRVVKSFKFVYQKYLLNMPCLICYDIRI